MNRSNPLKYVLVALLCYALLLAGCVVLEEKPAHIPYHSLYQEIEDPEAHIFLEKGLVYLRQNYAPLEFPVQEVYLRYSKKSEIGRSYSLAQGFSKTEILNRDSGICVIYIGVPPENPEFYPLLAHEIGHLKNPSIINDWAMEGFCMVFSEKLCAHLGIDWSIWKKRFNKSSKDPYAKAYWNAQQPN